MFFKKRYKTHQKRNGKKEKEDERDIMGYGATPIYTFI